MSDTRTRILDLAEQLIQRRGYNAFSYKDIADELGIKTASVHYHFPGKAVLAEEVTRRYIDKVMANLGAVAAAEPTRAGRIDAYLGAYRQLVDGDWMCLCLMLAAELLTLPEEVRSEVRRFVDGSVDWLAEAFALELEPGAARTEAVALFAAVEGGLVLFRVTGERARFEQAIARWT